jgi:ribonuclease-3
VDQDDDEALRVFAARLGHEFRDLEPLRVAITHRSFVNETTGQGPDNERIEFLGDAVLDLAVSVVLMELLPDAREGALSRAHARIVSGSALAHAARALELGDVLRVGKGEERSGGRARTSMLADALEAVLAAVYLDAGIDPVVALVRRHFAGPLEAVQRGEVIDPKTRLQELAQERFKTTPRYVVREATGPAHDKEFEVEILLGDESYGRGVGRSKKAAEQAAARTALRKVEGETEG